MTCQAQLHLVQKQTLFLKFKKKLEELYVLNKYEKNPDKSFTKAQKYHTY